MAEYKVNLTDTPRACAIEAFENAQQWRISLQHATIANAFNRAWAIKAHKLNLDRARLYREQASQSGSVIAFDRAQNVRIFPLRGA